MSLALLLSIIASNSSPRLLYEGPAVTASLVVPPDVTTMCFAAVAQGLNGRSTDGITYSGPALGGVSGAAAYVNNVVVTPGETLSVSVLTTESAVRRGATVLLRCFGSNFEASPGVVGFNGSGGPTIGASGGGRGGGGAAGLTAVSNPGTDGGVDGGNGVLQSNDGQGGGGNGLVRSLSNDSTSGAPGSGGTPGTVNGGKYGGGGGGAGFTLGTPRPGRPGGIGAVCVIWGAGRSFPNNSE